MYYAALLNQLKARLAGYNYDCFSISNLATYTSVVAIIKIHELILYPPNSPELAYSNHCVLPKLKKLFGGKNLSINEAIEAIKRYFVKLYFLECIRNLEKCVMPPPHCRRNVSLETSRRETEANPTSAASTVVL